jgi:hypothetical protein
LAPSLCAAKNNNSLSFKKAAMRKATFIIFSSLLLFSCDPDRGFINTHRIYVPVYATLADVHQYAVEPQKPTVQAGKIYAYGNYIFQNDLYTGIHIIDNRDQRAEKIAFLNIPLNTDIAIKGNYLYANNYTDLLVFDITDPTQPQFIKRVADVFPPVNQDYPPFTNIYFQCVDKSKGIVVKWEEHDSIPLPNCRR